MIRRGAELNLAARPLKVEIDELDQLKLPAILHWNLNHFVVLHRVKTRISGKDEYFILDPAIGERRVTEAEISRMFTGVALELTPTQQFRQKKSKPSIPVRDLIGDVIGVRSALIQAITLAFALEILAVASPLLNQFIIDEVLISGDEVMLKVLIFGFSLIAVSQIGIGFARSWFLVRWGSEISYQWSARLFSHLIRLPASFFEKRNLGDIASRFGSITSIQNTVTVLLVESVLDGIMAFIALGMMLFYSVTMTFVVLIGVALYALSRYIFFSYLKSATFEKIISSAKENTHFLESIRAVVPIKLFAHENVRASRWQNLKISTINRDVSIQKVSLIFRSLTATITATQMLCLLYIGASLVIAKEISLGMMIAFTGFATTFATRIFTLTDLWVDVKLLRVHVERVSDIALETPEEYSEFEIDMSRHKGKISINSLGFRYSNDESWIIRNASLTINEGETVAVIGGSGSGKSTLCKVLLGLLSPVEGTIALDGTDIKSIGLDQYRRVIGTVMQDDSLLSGTILENIVFFDSSPDIEFAERCAQLASIHDDINDMPMRYHSLIGELGTTLSGGQRQRLLLARALYKRPKILLLDEATSHLDIENERKVNEALRSLCVTKIVIAHRPETIRASDRIVLLHRGTFSEIDKDEFESRNWADKS